jgi:hypothetical protein
VGDKLLRHRFAIHVNEIATRALAMLAVDRTPEVAHELFQKSHRKARQKKNHVDAILDREEIQQFLRCPVPGVAAAGVKQIHFLYVQPHCGSRMH